MHLIPPSFASVQMLALLTNRTRTWMNELIPADGAKRVPFYYNWSKDQDPRYVCKRLFARYGDLKAKNTAYTVSKNPKARDYVELFSRQVHSHPPFYFVFIVMYIPNSSSQIICSKFAIRFVQICNFNLQLFGLQICKYAFPKLQFQLTINLVTVAITDVIICNYDFTKLQLLALQTCCHVRHCSVP